MTYDQFQAILDEIRRRQGTERPLVQVVVGPTIVRGRVSLGPVRAARDPSSPYALLVIEQPGLTRGPAAFVQIASIPDDGFSGIEPAE